MKNLYLVLIFCLFTLFCTATGGLKVVIYDFDGLNIGDTDLPDGDYRSGDVNYQVAATPLVQSDVLGDRALQVNLNWSTGTGEFGKGLSRFFELDASKDYINFYFYNPVTNSQDASVQVVITEDDNGNNIYEYGADDRWVYQAMIARNSGWQFISIPLSSFTDSNPGGNSNFDAAYSSPGGMLFTLTFAFNNTVPGAVSEQYFIDMICFSEGQLPQGTTVFDLPPGLPGDYCVLGALSNNDEPHHTPDEIEPLFANNKRIEFVNWFINYSKTGTSPDVYPGDETRNLLIRRYVPIITWESMFASYSRLDPVQPRLDRINNGSFDWYIDQVADKVKAFNDTVIMRIFHEFEGDWYPWSLTQNYQDPNIYIAAWRHVVDRFRLRGATKAKWMWCVNAEPKPYTAYNWFVKGYPGDNYVDIVATDIYNHPDLGTPAWKSFRYTLAETYFYLTKYFPNKPFYICEVGCRERNPGEPANSQTKGEWLCQMSKELKSYFNNTRALIFFSTVKEHDWRLNSSGPALAAANNCIWSDAYFRGAEYETHSEAYSFYPNPFINDINVGVNDAIISSTAVIVNIYDLAGRKVCSEGPNSAPHFKVGSDLSSGIYIVELVSGDQVNRYKVIKTCSDK